MTVYIGVDIHARQQTVSYVDTEDGILEQQELHHERDDIRGFYSQFKGEVIIGIEACGYTNWFEELMEDLGHKLAGRRCGRDQATGATAAEERSPGCQLAAGSAAA